MRADSVATQAAVPYATGAAACVVATVAFSVYARTLLPGVDLGDTGGFQAAVLWPETSARQAYPLFYGLARPFVLALTPDNPARGLNLFSALWGGLAAGLLTYVTARITRSLPAGGAAGLLLAFSHTFWTQSVIAEVYTLHLALVACCLAALDAYVRRPGTARLAVFFAIYAVSFGNHLSMILLFAPCALFLAAAHPRPRELLRVRTAMLAAGIAALAALLYAPDFVFVWTNIDAPAGWRDRVAAFWFDVTKSDWREQMMGGVDRAEMSERLAMWVWDARLQFGTAGLLLAAIGAARLWTVSRPWALLVWSAFLINTVFAITYNVGDAHVFFLPGHFFTALAIGCAWSPGRQNGRSSAPRAYVRFGHLAAVALIAYAGWRAWDTWPSVDRHSDVRADRLVGRVAAGVDDTNALLLADIGWQSENALLYSARYERRHVEWRRVAEVLPHLPFLVRDNHTIGRDIVLVGDAAARVAAAYGNLFPMAVDDIPASPTLADQAAALEPGTPYLIALLEPVPEESLDTADFDSALQALATSAAPKRSDSRFQVWAGTTGEPHAFHRQSNRPFRARFSILGDAFSVRMESWLPFDTFRRAGFGQVLRGRERVMTIERGVSLVWFERDGSPAVSYAAGLYAPGPRLRIPATVPQQLARGSDAMLEKAAP